MRRADDVLDVYLGLGHLRFCSGVTQRRPCGAQVVSNVFAHGRLGSAVKQTERGLCASRNLTGVNSLRRVRTCDVDGDGLLDSFLATGQTWWYASGKTQPWVFLRRSPARPTTCPAPVALT